MTPYRGLVVVVDRPKVGHESLDGIPDHEDGGVAVPKTAIQVHEAPHSPHGPLVSATPPRLAKYHAIVLRVGLEPLFDVRRLHIFIEKCVLALYPAVVTRTRIRVQFGAKPRPPRLHDVLDVERPFCTSPCLRLPRFRLRLRFPPT